jgi:hypothetical protein
VAGVNGGGEMIFETLWESAKRNGEAIMQIWQEAKNV